MFGIMEIGVVVESVSLNIVMLAPPGNESC